MKNTPSESITATLARGKADWPAKDYFISADEYLAPGKVRFRPDYYALFICVEGWLKGQINHRSMELTPYCFVAAGPDTVIQVNAISQKCKGRFLFFTRDFLLNNLISPSLLDAFHYLSEHIGYCLPLKRPDAKCLLQLYTILEGKRGEENTIYHKEIIRSIFFTFLLEAAEIYKKEVRHAPSKRRRDLDLHRQFTELLVMHDRREHHLRFYADSLFITPKYLIKAIKSACGKTPGTLIDEALIAEAKLLLQDRENGLADIAELLQFSDQASFSKFFKRHTSSSPSAYRQAWLKP